MAVRKSKPKPFRWFKQETPVNYRGKHCFECEKIKYTPAWKLQGKFLCEGFPNTEFTYLLIKHVKPFENACWFFQPARQEKLEKVIRFLKKENAWEKEE